MKLLFISALVLVGLCSIVENTDAEQFSMRILETIALEDKRRLGEPERTSRPADPHCQNLGGGVSTNVHALKVQDVTVMGAIGDSLTAASGGKAATIAGLLFEDRGISWSAGCESSLPDTFTFASLLKSISPNLYGCSTGTGNQNHTNARLNLAKPGATSFHMLDQARMLVARAQQTVTDVENNWKVINFFIGGNDLCGACTNPNQTPTNFFNNIVNALEYFRQNLKRTVVNLVLTLDVSGVNILNGALACSTLQNRFCDCGLDAGYASTLKDLTLAYQTQIANHVNSGIYDNDPLFTVALHSFMTKMVPPMLETGAPDLSYFAPDCFHFSRKGHEVTGIELWNSMLTPHHLRSDHWNIGSTVKCPTLVNPYIFTRKNSGSLKTLIMG